MAKTRVHNLAKEYGMSSKEMLDHLATLKIPAKSASSTLEDAYIPLIKKSLKPILEARAAQIEANKLEEKKAQEEQEKAAVAQAEQERLEIEKRREQERALEEQKRKAAEAARVKEEQRKEKERAAAEAEKRARPKDTAPRSIPNFSSLLDQIAAQTEVLEQRKKEEEEKQARKAEAKAKKAQGQHAAHAGQKFAQDKADKTAKQNQHAAGGAQDAAQLRGASSKQAGAGAHVETPASKGKKQFGSARGSFAADSTAYNDSSN